MAFGSVASTFLAAAFARVIHGYLLDRMAAGASAPLVIVDLCAESPRFGYQLIHELRARAQRFQGPSPWRFAYVMTSDSEDTLARWHEEPWLAPLIQDGILDFAVVDLDGDLDGAGDRPLLTRVAKVALSAENRVESMVVLASGVFSRYQEPLFYVERGRLYRCSHPDDRDTTSEPRVAPDAYRLDLVTDADSVFENPVWNQVLAGYAERLNRSAFSFPRHALAWFERMRGLARSGMLLCADRGYVHEESIRGRQLPADPASHEVNFNAFSECVLCERGAVLAPPRPGDQATVMAFLHGEIAAPPVETVRAYYDAVADAFGPDEWHTLEPLIAASLPRASVEELLAYLRLGAWDDRLFARCLPHLLARVQAGEVSADTRESLRYMVREVWSRHVPAPHEPSSQGDDPPDDLAFTMGVLCFGLAFYELAQGFFEVSLERSGQSAAVHYNLALCAAQAGRRDQALERLDAALALDPDFLAARDMRLRVMGSM